MNAKKKAIALVLCALMLVAASVFGTLAYLTDTDEVVTNTFTVGHVAIKLDEAKVTEYGVKDGDTRVTANTYKLVPGHNYLKDPTIHVEQGSEKCWLFVKITNEIDAIDIDEIVNPHAPIATQLQTHGWTALPEENGVYYHAVVDATNATVDVKIFDDFTIKSDVKDLSDYAGKQIIVNAYAIQADGFANENAAWTALKNELPNNS